MADVKISGLPAAGALAGDELLEIVQAGASRRSTVAEVVEQAGVGRHTIWLPATAWLPRLSNGAAVNRGETPTGRVMLATLDFDPVIVEYAQTSLVLPKSWNGNLTAQVHWTAGGGFGSVLWALQALALRDGVALNANFGTPRVALDLFTGANLEHCTPETSPIMAAGSPAAGDRLVLQLYRDPSTVEDTLTADAKLLGVTLFYGTSAATDD